MTWWTAMALATGPTVEITDDSTVHGEVVVAATLEHVREKMADPTWIAAVDDGGTTVEIVERSGDCVVTDSVSPSAVKTVEYRVRRCKTEDGWQGTLVSSNTFDSYEVRWRLSPEGAGTKLTYDLALSTSMMVPQFIINRQTRNGVERLLKNLHAEFSEPAPQTDEASSGK